MDATELEQHIGRAVETALSTRNGSAKWLQWANLGGLLTALVLVANVSLQLGRYSEMLKRHETVLAQLTEQGSPGLKTHEQIDKMRDDMMSSRIATVENAIVTLQQMQLDVRFIKQRWEEMDKKKTP